MKADRRFGAQAPTASALAGRHVAMLFEKPSLRTRSTFEIAVTELGAETLHVPSEFADGTREPLDDVARNLERWVHALVVRTYAQDKVASMAAAAPQLHVINALSDEQHPCQALADMMTLQRALGHAARPRAWRSWATATTLRPRCAHAARAAWHSVSHRIAARLRAPAQVVDARVAGARATAPAFSCSAIRARPSHGADAIYTDVWTSMGQEREADRRKQIFAPYQVNASADGAPRRRARCSCTACPRTAAKKSPPRCFDSPASVVFDQAENRLHTQKALLLMLAVVGRPHGRRPHAQ